MEVWACFPTVHLKETNEIASLWKEYGYKVAVFVNPPFAYSKLKVDKVFIQNKWEGFGVAANILCHGVPGDVVVLIGDDILPHPGRTAQEIGEEFKERFPDLFGVMQPTGDDYGSIKICAISPWIGRGFIEKAYGGQGPYWGEYKHYYSDHELQVVATLLGAFQQRPDLIQYHDHWQRRNERRPKHLRKAKRGYVKDKQLFRRRKGENFPGHQGLGEFVEGQGQAWNDFYRKFSRKIESGSGVGSSLTNTEEIRQALPVIFQKYGIKTFTDIPCGDWNWMKKVPLDGIDYLGCDIVPEVIKDNTRKYPDRIFQLLNLVTSVPRKSDLILCRDLLFHLSNNWIEKALRNIKQSGSKWLLATSSQKVEANADLTMGGTVGWREIDLCLPPFNLPKPVEIIQENDSSSCRGRIIGLFDMEEK